MSTTHTIEAKSPAKRIIGTQYFDLLHTIGELLPSQRLRENVLSSMCWSIDNLLINATRGLFFRMLEAQREVAGVESFTEFTEAMRGHAFRQETFNLVGKGGVNDIVLIRQLNLLRDKWYDAYLPMTEGRKDFVGRPKSIIKPDLEEVINNEKPMKVDGLTIAKFKAMVEWRAKHSPTTIDQDKLLADLIARRTAQNADMHERRQQLAPTIAAVIKDALSVELHTLYEKYEGNDYADDSDVEFYDLDTETQRTLIERAVSAIGRAVEQVASDRKVDVMEFMTLNIEADSAINDLNEVLRAPKYNREGALPEDVQRLNEHFGGGK